MSEIKMLPLPKPTLIGRLNYLPHEMQSYGVAMAEHNVAAKDAEIEALRAEVAAWRELSDHVRAGACNAIWPDRYTDARTRDVAAALKRAERLAEALRECIALGHPRDPAIIAARTALRDHDQEVGNG